MQLATGCFMDGWTRLTPYLAVIDTENICIGGLGASSNVACPCSAGASSGTYSDDWIFYFQRTHEKKVPLTCIGEEVRILHSFKNQFCKNFFSFLIVRIFCS